MLFMGQLLDGVRSIGHEFEQLFQEINVANSNNLDSGSILLWLKTLLDELLILLDQTHILSNLFKYEIDHWVLAALGGVIDGLSELS